MLYPGKNGKQPTTAGDGDDERGSVRKVWGTDDRPEPHMLRNGDSEEPWPGGGYSSPHETGHGDTGGEAVHLGSTDGWVAWIQHCSSGARIVISSLVVSGGEQGGSILPWILVIGLGMAGLATLYLWPWARCRRCEGSGKLGSPLDQHWRTCPRCTGSGKRYRTGRQVIQLVNKADVGRGRK